MAAVSPIGQKKKKKEQVLKVGGFLVKRIGPGGLTR